MKPQLLALGTCLVFSGCALPMPHYEANTAQLTGRVIDARTERPITAASVSVRDHLKTRTSTDARGYFTTGRDTSFHPFLFIIPAPTYTVYVGSLDVSAPGYRPAAQEFSIAHNPINEVPLVTLTKPIRLQPQ